MRCKTILLVTVLVLSLPHLALAQFGRWGDEREGDMEQWIKSGRMRPFLEFNYGMATPKFKDMNGSFASLGLAELKLGFSAVDSLRSALVGLDERYVFGSFMSDDLRATGSAGEGEDLSELGRFGVGNRLGYGYGWKAITLELYNQNALNWTTVRATDYDNSSADAQAIFDRYGTELRFGQLMAAGAKVHLARSIAISGSVEGAVIFPRYVFWPWLGSAMLYSGVQGGLQFFSEQIVNVSPVIGPILHFILKNGVSLAYYKLLQGDMAWPFDYEQPLTVESYNMGVSLTF